MIVPMQSWAISQGEAIVVVGLLALLLWAVVRFRSLTGTVLWGLTVLIYISVVGLGVPQEFFTLALVFTAGITMLAGAVYWGARL